jgi:hypothetical protein
MCSLNATQCTGSTIKERSPNMSKKFLYSAIPSIYIIDIPSQKEVGLRKCTVTAVYTVKTSDDIEIEQQS